MHLQPHFLLCGMMIRLPQSIDVTGLKPEYCKLGVYGTFMVISCRASISLPAS